MPTASLTVDRCLVGAAVVLTCVLFLPSAADPVNVVKLTALVLVALALVGAAAVRTVRTRLAHVPLGGPALAAGLLLLALVVSALVAPSWATAVVGAYGRNSGLAAYACATVLFLVATRAFTRPGTRVLIGAVTAAGLFTASYGLLQRLGVDAIAWNNPFNPIIAAMGNPDFASGYLGITVAVSTGGALWSGWDRGWRIACGLTAVLAGLTAALSDAVQGPFAAVGGLAVVALALVLDQPAPRRRAGLGVLAGLVVAGVGTLLLGLAGGGPLAGYFAGLSFDARTWYWTAALDMFAGRPVTGVGLDSFGAFWRTSRPAESVAGLGGADFTDAAHSVPLQMLAQGGLLLAAAYLVLLVVVATALVRGLLRLEGPDRMLLAAVGGGWVAYQTQSLVSIDQVPLIVLHFTLAGAVVAAAGAGRWREVRLPGAPAPAVVHRNDARTKRRTAGTTVPQRTATGADALLLSGLVVLVLAAAWLALVPLRANLAARDGDVALARGAGNEALTSYERASELLPGQSLYWVKTGLLFENVQQPARAQRAYAEAARQDPYDVSAVRSAARAAEASGDLDGARARHQDAVRLDPWNSATLSQAATFELRHSGAAAARRLMEDALRRLPREAVLWATLGDARAVLGDPAGAREAYERALELEPGQPVATAGLEKLTG